MTETSNDQHLLSPLEEFVRTYLETSGGAWEEVEPQVYDVLLPDVNAMTRITFDPEALPEHPGAQLASFGTPFVNDLLAGAVRRGRSAHFHMIGLNLTPHDLASRARRAISLPAPLELHLDHVRALNFLQAAFWFQAEFISDQREQEILSVAIDLHAGREVRHLDKLMERHRLSEQPAELLPDARRISVAAGYNLGRTQVLRSVAAIARSRHRELNERLERQITRIHQYYSDMRDELQQETKRARDKQEALARQPTREQGLSREEQMRLTELRQKNALRVQLRLLQLLLIHQPKLLLQAKVKSDGHAPISLDLVWDPLMEMVEAPPCPVCRHPSYAFELTRQGELVCPACAARVLVPGKKGR